MTHYPKIWYNPFYHNWKYQVATNIARKTSGALGLGYAAYKGIKYIASKPDINNPIHRMKRPRAISISGRPSKRRYVARVKQIKRNVAARKIIKKYKYKGRRKFKGRTGRRWGGQQNESGNSFSITYKKSKNYKTYKAIAMPQKEVSTKPISTLFSDITAGTGGRQLVVLIDSYNKGLDFAAFSNNPNWYNALVSGGGATVLHNSSTQATAESSQLLHQFVNVKYILSNAAPSDCVGHIYYIMAKESRPFASTTDPFLDWGNMVASENGDATAYATYTAGTKPTDLKKWNIKWRVIKKIPINLGSGAELTINFRFNTNRVVDLAYANEYQVIRGLTIYTMFIGHGQLTDSTNDKTVGNVTYSPVKLVAIQEVTNSYRQVQQYQRKTFFTNTLSTTLAGFIQDENSGVVDNAFLAANYA